MIRIRRHPEHDAYSLWDTERGCYVNKWGDPDEDYHCDTREVAVMRRRDLNEYRREAAERAVTRSQLQRVWMHAGDLERLEKAAECAARAHQLELATSLWAIILRVRQETGWTAEASNVTPIR